MEFGWITLLRMASAVVVAVLLLSPQLDGNLVSGLMLQLKDCNSISFSYSSTSGDEIFYINENLVDRESFCKELKFHYENGCVFDRYLRNPNCGQDISSVDFFSVGGRKLLQKEVSRESKPVDSNVQSSQSRNDKQSNHSFVSPTKVGLAAAGLFILCCTLLCPCFYKKKKEATDSNAMLGRDLNSMDSTSFENSVSEKVPASPLRVPPSPSRYSVSPKLSRLGSIHFNLSQVNRATNNFSEKMLLGEGGFGRVYKAQLGDGLIVAVKRAKKELFETLQTEFSSEVDLLSKIEHRNLVKLLGYVNQGNERLIITEYVPNGTLRKHLDGQGGRILDFNQRLEIAIDVAHGLTYLHSYAEKQIIHRDVKSSNILLTESLRAKVADFGFARLGPMDSERTHVSTKVKGTVGYLDPEYMRTYQLTTKSDVYSFGILLIEILTGRRPVEKDKPNDERITLRWAFSNYNEGNVTVLVDPLMREYVKTEVLVKIFGLAMQCAAPRRTDRPDMRSVGEQLWVIRADYLKSANRG